MKKQVSIAVVLALIGTVGFGAISSAHQDSAELGTPIYQVKSVSGTPVQGEQFEPIVSANSIQSEPRVGMLSPIHEFSTLVDAVTYIGFEPHIPKVLPVGYNVESIHTINRDTLHITYVYQPGEDVTQNQAMGTRINYRVSLQKGDISGDYNDYNVVKTVKVNGKKVTFKGGNKMVRLATWDDGVQNHSIAFERAVTYDMAKAIVETVKANRYHGVKQ
ncbi:hypothetical protein [Veillonella caviae]|uniref:hypothetical protein n=1 Tax=Veillonella caviae TaxID=248316 RepID=UPI0023A8E4EB|nr:hypothetical protein [Veillonella caviae]MCI5708012.1 hypothetical protein [Veillonella caviae]